jgi:hypothetical protein
LEEDIPAVMGADPGAVKLKDGGWLLAVTGPPRDGRPQTGPGDDGQRASRSPLMSALDINGDGVLDKRELENAMGALRRLDRNGDGRLTPEEFRSAR